MIGSVFIKCNAASPNLPLKPLFTFKGSPSSLRVIDVPRKIGAWQITAVHVAATYPDNRAVSKSAVLTGGAWVATLDAPDAVGTVAGGLTVTADGVDEQGGEVTGYVLGVGDLSVLDRDVAIERGGEVYYLHFFDDVPDTPHKGDMCVIGGALKWWNGEAWELFGAGGDMSHSEFAALPADDLVADEVGLPEICEVINKMKNALRPAAGATAALVAAIGLALSGAATATAATAETAKLSALKGASNVVTAVSFDGLATDAALASATNALSAAIASATPGDYANVSNLAYAAASAAELAAATNALSAADAALSTAVAGKADATALAAHTGDKANPHGVTAAQVGAYSKAEVDSNVAAETARAKAAEKNLNDLGNTACDRASTAKGIAESAYNDLGYHMNNISNPHNVTAAQLGALTAETDPTVSAWAKAASKPTYTAAEVGAYSKSETDTALAAKADADALSSLSEATTAALAAKADTDALAAHTGDKANPHGVTAEQVGALTEEADPNFAAWKDGSSIAAGSGSKASGNPSSALGIGNTASGYASSALGNDNRANAPGSSALGYQAYTASAWTNSLAVSQTPDLIYLGSSTTNEGATARTLQAYLDEKADASALSSLAPRYALAAADFTGAADATLAAADGRLYAVTADAQGIAVVLPAASAEYAQDFAVRLAPADTNGTFLAQISGAAGDATDWRFDYPTGTNAVFGTVASPTYITFTQVSADRWSVTAYAATKEDAE